MKSKGSMGRLLSTLFVTTADKDTERTGSKGVLNFLTGTTLRLMAIQFNLRPSLKKYLRSKDGWINFSVGFLTESKSVEKAIVFCDGKVRVTGKIPKNADIKLRFHDESVLKEMAASTPNEMLNLVLKNKMVLEGNLACLQLFNFYVSLIMGPVHQKMLDRASRKDTKTRKKLYKDLRSCSEELRNRALYRMKGSKKLDPGVKHLEDPYLSKFTIEQFPRLKGFLDIHFNVLPEICPERPKLLTDWFRENGFEKDNNGSPWNPELRQGLAFKHLMKNRKPIIRKNDLIAGTTTSKETGVIVFPDSQGTMIWGELNSVEKRILYPYTCTRETASLLHNEVFPFWMGRNFREFVRKNYNAPLCQQLDERFVAYFIWKTVGISHTIPNFKRLLEKGTTGIIADIDTKLSDPDLKADQKNPLTAMKLCLEGINIYAENLSNEAARLASTEEDDKRKGELGELKRICSNIPLNPAETLNEAVNSLWIFWTAIHMENSNTGTSLGRLDQLFQPYFEKDLSKLETPKEKETYIKNAIELIGCLFMRLTDHVPLSPDVGNYLFGGASSTQAITIGGITPDGKDGVNDMTYIFLKATELLGIRDANINARYHLAVNSDQYLKRLCEVNIITSATPIMQNDTAVIKALTQHGYPAGHINDWAATGCVEPTLQGQHFSHTGSILMNMVASMEMALNNGTHPVMHWDPGPKTGSIEKNDFTDFEDFFNAWAAQQNFLIEQAVLYNNLLGHAHKEYRPTPLLSAMIDGSIESGKDVLHGGARYNSSGTSNIGLVDVTDSLLVIKKLVFDEKKVSFKKLKEAVDSDFENDPVLLAMVRNKVKLFGSGDNEAVEMANRVAGVVHKAYMSHTNYRGGRYATGFWSMSQHVAYGSLSGTLPSGRLKGKAFTPGLTPNPGASKNFLDNISAVSRLNPEYMDNNIAFNVKLTPSAEDSREKTVDNMFSYVKSYFEQGGMQMQFNMVTSEILKDAVANPENYRSLLVRISGYNAYFVTLNRDIQTELIERTEFGI